MLEHLIALVVILVLAGVVFAFAKAAAAVPFVASMLPSERAKAARAPVAADIGKVERRGRLKPSIRRKTFP